MMSTVFRWHVFPSAGTAVHAVQAVAVHSKVQHMSMSNFLFWISNNIFEILSLWSCRDFGKSPQTIFECLLQLLHIACRWKWKNMIWKMHKHGLENTCKRLERRARDRSGRSWEILVVAKGYRGGPAKVWRYHLWCLTNMECKLLLWHIINMGKC